MNTEKINLGLADLRKKQRKSSRDIAALCLAGVILAGFLKWTGQSETVYVSALLLTGFFVIFERFRQIENMLEHYENRYLLELTKEIDRQDWEKEIDRMMASNEKDRLKSVNEQEC